jgi:hypothetical protein
MCAVYLLILFLQVILYQNASFSIPQILIWEGGIAFIFFSFCIFSDFKKTKTLNAFQLYCLGALLRIGVGGIYAGALIQTNNEELLTTMGHLPLIYLPGSIFLMQIASLLFILGLICADKPQFYTDKLKGKLPSDFVVWAYTLIGWAWKLYSEHAVIQLGVFNYIVVMLPLCGMFIFTLAALTKKRGASLYKIYVLLIIIGELWFVRETGMRESFIFTILPVLIAFGLHTHFSKQDKSVISIQSNLNPLSFSLKRKIKKRLHFLVYIAGGLIILFLLFVLFPAASLIKKGESQSIDRAIIIVTEKLQKNISLVHHFPDGGIFAISHRMALIVVAPALIQDLINRSVPMPYDPAQIIIAGFVPRFLWHDKPIISRGQWFSRLLNSESWNTKTAIAMTAAGEFYWAYRWTGVILGMFLMGWLTGRLWGRFLKDGLTNHIGVAGMIFVTQESLRWFESEATAPLNLLLIFYLLTSVYGLIFFHKRKILKQSIC